MLRSTLLSSGMFVCLCGTLSEGIYMLSKSIPHRQTDTQKDNQADHAEILTAVHLSVYMRGTLRKTVKKTVGQVLLISALLAFEMSVCMESFERGW
jgi:hypothetical protein